MNKKEVVHELQHALKLYAISPEDSDLNSILIYASMLVGLSK